MPSPSSAWVGPLKAGIPRNVAEDLDVRSACLFPTLDPEWREKLRHAGLVLLIPVIGWPMLLGYRKLTVERILLGSEPVLPDWRGAHWHCLIEGAKCCGVIATYMLPATCLFWSFGGGLESYRETPILVALAFAVALPIFLPLVLPLAVVYCAAIPENPITLEHAAAVMSLYAVGVFLVPMGFLRVSLTRHYLSALNVPACLRIGFGNFRMYLLAWKDSIAISLIGHFAIPFSPWGIAWAYLGIVYCFNEVLIRSAPGHSQSLGGALQLRLNPEHWSPFCQEASRWIRIYSPTGLDGFSTVRLGTYEVPLPRVAERLVRGA